MHIDYSIFLTIILPNINYFMFANCKTDLTLSQYLFTKPINAGITITNIVMRTQNNEKKLNVGHE